MTRLFMTANNAVGHDEDQKAVGHNAANAAGHDAANAVGHDVAGHDAAGHDAAGHDAAGHDAANAVGTMQPMHSATMQCGTIQKKTHGRQKYTGAKNAPEPIIGRYQKNTLVPKKSTEVTSRPKPSTALRSTPA